MYQLFQNVYDQLEEGGIFLFDYLESHFLGDQQKVAKVVEAENWSMFIELSENKEKQVLTRDITLFRKMENGLFHRSREVHQVRLFNRQELLGVLQDIGFVAEPVYSYNGLKLRDKHVGILARKMPPM